MPAALIVLISFAGAMVASRASVLPPLESDYVLGVAVAGFIAMLASAREPTGILATVGKALAGRSYTLYALHLPFAVFLSAVLVPARLRPSGGAALVLAAVLVFVSLYVQLGWPVTEARTGRVSWALEALVARFDRRAEESGAGVSGGTEGTL